MATGKTDGLKELTDLVAATNNKKVELTLTVTGQGSMRLNLQKGGKPIITSRSASLSYDYDVDAMARWGFYALAGKALGVDV